MDIVRRGEHLALVNVIDAYGLQDLGLHEMTYAAFRHDRYRYRIRYPLDHQGIAHPRYAAGCAYVRRYPFQCHYGAGPCLLGYERLLRGRNIHYDSASECLCQIRVGFIFLVFHASTPLDACL
ncbi:hypothetical protein SDC9_116121 [bioreactor metagenome]|uniref:Uncharacterized protein n=1 Tax=bioreactor metagenome TaxID=1076179 RepID=A0A645BVE4_9ZZZZ